MDSQDRKLQQRIARRKEKVQRLIAKQQKNLSALDSDTYPHPQDYWQALSRTQKKLRRLEQELQALKAGRLSRLSGSG
jgi:hypothetical protein